MDEWNFRSTIANAVGQLVTVLTDVAADYKRQVDAIERATVLAERTAELMENTARTPGSGRFFDA